MKERIDSQQRAKDSQQEADWVIYKKLRNRVNLPLKREKNNWRMHKLKSLNNNSGQLWKNVKDWFGWTKGGPPTKSSANGEIFSKPRDLARIMNEHFVK